MAACRLLIHLLLLLGSPRRFFAASFVVQVHNSGNVGNVTDADVARIQQETVKELIDAGVLEPPTTTTGELTDSQHANCILCYIFTFGLGGLVCPSYCQDPVTTTTYHNMQEGVNGFAVYV